MIELDVNALLQLLLFVRKCEHAGPNIAGDRWCMACGSARVQGTWLTPSWFDALDKVLAGVPGRQVS